MVNEELTEYRGYEEEIRGELESQYTTQIFNKEVGAAYETLGKLMKYKLIERDDIRIEKNNKSFKAAGVAKDHRFDFDYRKDYSFIPRWLYGEPRNNRTIRLNSITHWDKRVEGSYSGDTIFEGRPIEIRIAQCNTVRQVENALEDIKQTYLIEASTDYNTDKISEMAKAGVYRIYNIEVQSNCISSYKKLGTVVLRMSGDGPEAKLLLRNNSIVNLWMNLEDTIKAIKETMNYIIEGCKCSIVISPKKALEKQAGMIKMSNLTDKSNQQRKEHKDN